MSGPELSVRAAFQLQARLKSTIAVNHLFSRLKIFPLIGRLIPPEIFRRHQLKESLCYPTLFLKLLGKIFKILCYHSFILWLSVVATASHLDPSRRALTHFLHPLESLQTAQAAPEQSLASFLAIWLFYTLLGAALNRNLFPASSESESYLIHFLRMPAKRYLLMRYTAILIGNYCLQTLSLCLFSRLGRRQPPEISLLLWSLCHLGAQAEIRYPCGKSLLQRYFCLDAGHCAGRCASPGSSDGRGLAQGLASSLLEKSFQDTDPLPALCAAARPPRPPSRLSHPWLLPQNDSLSSPRLPTCPDQLGEVHQGV